MKRGWKIWRNIWLPFAMAAVLLFVPPAFSQDTKPVSVTVSPQGKATRIVLDYNRLTAYRARANDGAIVVNIDNPAPLTLPAGGGKGVSSLSSSMNDTITSLKIAITPGSTFKDYRLGKKIVIDVTPGKDGDVAAAKPPAEKPKEKPPEKVAEKPVEKPAAPPTALKQDEKGAPPPPDKAQDKTPEKAAETAPDKPKEPTVAEVSKAINDKMPAVPAPAVIVDTAPPETAAGVTPQAVEPTTITVSTIEPTRLAVFKRFGTLWVVLDTEAAGATPPSVSGPDAGLLGNAKLVKLKGGTAYRYTLPPNRFISATRENLTWHITLATGGQQSGQGNPVNVVFDDVSAKAHLMVELKDASKVLEMQDPVIGDTLEIVAAPDETQRVDQPRRYSDVEIIPASIGFVSRPLSEGVKVNRVENFIMVTSALGITATPGATAGPTVVASSKKDHDEPRLFDFPNWRQGGETVLYKNAQALQKAIAAADKPEDKTALMMKLALLYFANNFGQEALGTLRIIEDESPDMVKNPNFIALRGAANAMAGHYPEALKDLSFPAIQQHGEVNLWIGYAAAATEQWHMANRAFPSDNYLLLQYPQNIAVPFTIYMAESALRLGKTDTANSLLASLDTMQGGFDKHNEAAVNYLKGEAARQAGHPDEAIKIWRPVAFGIDRLYHTKASLALANLRLDQKQITTKDAIDALDSLRFAWRGDGLEVQILHNLGLLKVQDKKYLSGLEDMKTAVKLADQLLDDSQPIKDDMAKTFSDLFVGGKAKDVQPLEAVSIYNGFTEFMPPGEEGSVATLNFADNLITMDLLEKAEGLLEDQLKSGYLPAAKVPGIENKLMAVYLLDSMPQKTLDTLKVSGMGTDKIADERVLLRARALSQLGRTDEAIASLNGVATRDALKLKADVLWRARKWKEAAQTIEQLLPPPSGPLSEDDAQMVINAAVGYKLASDQNSVANVKSRYGAVMEATTLGSTFGVVTRTGGGTKLSDRDTILKIAGEVDMFKGFLDTYKAGKGS